MNTLLGIGAAVIGLAATWVVLKMLFRGLFVLVKLAGFATLALAAAYATIHTAELTDPDLGGLKGVFNRVEKDVALRMETLPRIKINFELVEPDQIAREDNLAQLRTF